MTGFELAITCLALAVYKEAQGEPDIGKLWVAHVVINRTVNSGHHDICTTVLEPNQFSWTATDMRHGVLLPKARPDRNSNGWIRSEIVARMAFEIPNVTNGSTHFYSGTNRPAWAKKMQCTGKVGEHTFFRGLK